MIKKLGLNLLQRIKELEYKLGLIADYVVETGTDGIWTYEKRESGKATCWGTFTHTVTTWNTWGNLFEGHPSFYKTYPSGLFVEAPQLIPSTSNIACSGVEVYMNGSETRTPNCYLIRPTTLQSSVLCTVHLEAIGKWK